MLWQCVSKRNSHIIKSRTIYTSYNTFRKMLWWHNGSGLSDECIYGQTNNLILIYTICWCNPVGVYQPHTKRIKIPAAVQTFGEKLLANYSRVPNTRGDPYEFSKSSQPPDLIWTPPPFVNHWEMFKSTTKKSRIFQGLILISYNFLLTKQQKHQEDIIVL